jgi:hypothetical protein
MLPVGLANTRISTDCAQKPPRSLFTTHLMCLSVAITGTTLTIILAILLDFIYYLISSNIYIDMNDMGQSLHMLVVIYS